MSLVSALLDSLRECGSVAVQCESLLGAGAGSEEGARLSALECVRGMSPAGLGRVDASEASLLSALVDRVGCTEGRLTFVEREMCWMSLFVLCCRNGKRVAASADAMLALLEASTADYTELGMLMQGTDAPDVEFALRVVCAATACCWGPAFEGLLKSTPQVRTSVEALYLKTMRQFAERVCAAFSVEVCVETIARARMLMSFHKQETVHEASLSCGAALTIAILVAPYPVALTMCDTAKTFETCVALLRRVCPSPLPTEYWLSTCAEVDVTSAQIGPVMQLLAGAIMLDQPALESALWLGEASSAAAHICKVNSSAELSARPGMALSCVVMSARVVEAAARVESHAMSLLDSGVVEALDYGCLNDFAAFEVSVAGQCARAAIALVGRNEGGKTLSRSAAHAVLDELGRYFDPSSFRSRSGTRKMVPIARCVVNFAVADANKKLMLEYDGALSTLVRCLLLDDDNPRRGQDGADALQEMCAGVLHELALYGP
eukprot:COSAG04_NODE_4136_length_2276_cov_18.885622_2_plen_491_part_01